MENDLDDVEWLRQLKSVKEPDKLKGERGPSMFFINKELNKRFRDVVGKGNASAMVEKLMRQAMTRWEAAGLVDGLEAGQKRKKPAK